MYPTNYTPPPKSKLTFLTTLHSYKSGVEAVCNSNIFTLYLLRNFILIQIFQMMIFHLEMKSKVKVYYISFLIAVLHVKYYERNQEGKPF